MVYINLLLLPLMSYLAQSLLGIKLGRYGSVNLSIVSMMITALLSLFVFYEVCLSQTVASIYLYDWCYLNIYNIEIGYLFDSVSSTIVLVVCVISFLVQVYSMSYMSHDPSITRFFSYLTCFTFCMLLLVTAPNFLQMFIGWEGVGVCSYLLINFWFTRILANKAALKAMIMNRIADVFFILGICLILITFKTTDYMVVNNLLGHIVNENYVILNVEVKKITVITFFLFIGAMGKSAQIGFHTWLPAAMEGPTPVSSLLHAATMVVAGVFLVIRCSIFFELSENILFLLVIFGGVTSLFSGIIAVFQYDLKKVIAYSTCSQLGYMFFSCGLSNYYLAFFHLWNHAFFKALLFLSAGVIIHGLFDEQDIRRMGFLKKIFPFTYICFFIGTLAIIGFPYLTGFYSKDLIIELAYSRLVVDSLFIYFFGLTSAVFTAIYSIRLIFFVFTNALNTNVLRSYFVSFLKQDPESEFPMFFSMFTLCIASIFVGNMFSDLMVGEGTFYWNNSIFIKLDHYTFFDMHYINAFIKFLPVFFSLLSMYITYLIMNYIDIAVGVRFNILEFYAQYLYPLFYIVSKYSFHEFFFNKIYNWMFLSIFKFSYWTTNKYLDKGWFEYYGPYGMYLLFSKMHFFFKKRFDYLLFNNLFVIFLANNLLISLYLILNISVLLLNNIGLIALIYIYIFLQEKI